MFLIRITKFAWTAMLIELFFFTWNWALMLGGRFFLCRWSKDLVVRSWRPTINFSERESNRFCPNTQKQKVNLSHKETLFCHMNAMDTWRHGKSHSSLSCSGRVSKHLPSTAHVTESHKQLWLNFTLSPMVMEMYQLCCKCYKIKVL